MNNDTIFKIRRITCRFIHNGTCKYFDKGVNYINNQRPKKNNCGLEGHERNDKELCTYCCTYCCKSMVSYKHTITFQQDMAKVKSDKYASPVEAKEVNSPERSKKKEIGQVGLRHSKQKMTATNNFTINGIKYNKEEKKKTFDESKFNKRIKSKIWKRPKSITRYIQGSFTGYLYTGIK